MKAFLILPLLGFLTILSTTSLVAQSHYATPYTFTTLAGVGPGTTDSIGTASRFFNPEGIAVDNTGNLYVADMSNHVIRKITSNGTVTTLAGLSGIPGYCDGTGSAARFQNPQGLAVDGSGNVYVADTSNCTIRKITPDGTVTTLAGSAGAFGNVNDTGSAARFGYVSGVAVDSNGNVYAADTSNSAIRKITPAGVVTTLPGQFNYPRGVTVDGNGNVYVADTENNIIRKIAPGGAVTTLAGNSTTYGSHDDTGTAAQFYSPRSVATDVSGNVYVADALNCTIRKITPDGTVTTLAGNPGSSGSDDGTGSAARFDNPSGVTVDGGGNIYVADTLNATIRKITSGGVVTTLIGSAGGGGNNGTGSAARFAGPSGIAVDGSGNVYVTEAQNNTIRKITPNGETTSIAGLAGISGSDNGVGSAAHFFNPNGVVAAANGNLFVVDTYNQTLRKILPDGTVSTLLGTVGVFGNSTGLFYNPYGMAADSTGNLYIADTTNSVIQKLTPTGQLSVLAGHTGNYGSTDATGDSARFNYPTGVAADGNGNLYVTDCGNNTIRKITPLGTVTTLAGTAGTIGSTDGIGCAARFNAPMGIAVDSGGNVYVADTNNNTIRMISPAGVVTTLAGLAGTSGNRDGTGYAARFSGPTGVAVDGNDNLYVTDYANNTVRLGTPNLRYGQALAFNPVGDQTIGTTPVTIALAATTNSGAPILYSVLFGHATINGNILTITGAGNITISASQGGTLAYDEAFITQSFNALFGSTDTPIPFWVVIVMAAGIGFIARQRLKQPLARHRF